MVGLGDRVPTDGPEPGAAGLLDCADLQSRADRKPSTKNILVCALHYDGLVRVIPGGLHHRDRGLSLDRGFRARQSQNRSSFVAAETIPNAQVRGADPVDPTGVPALAAILFRELA